MTNNRNDVSQNAKIVKRGLIAHLRAAAGLDKPARESMSSLEGRQMLAAATITGTLANQNINDNDTLTPFGAVTVADIDSDVLSVEVQIDNTTRGTFTNGSVTSSGFTSEGSGRYTFFGSPTEVTDALRTLVYNPTDNRVPVNFSETNRFTITVDDATDIVTDNTTTVRSISANDAPVIGSFTASTTINDTATTSPFSSVTVTDVDPFQTLSAIVTIDDSAKGEFTSASLTSSGFTSAGNGLYAFSGRVANVQTALRALVYQPVANRVAVGSTETATFTVQVTDNIASPQIDSTTQVTSTSVNNAPSISGAAANQSAFDNGTVQPFTNITFSDVDPGQTLTATVTLDSAAKGAFSGGSLTNSGFSDAGGGVYTRTGSVSALTTAIRALVFVPTENRVAIGNSETTTFNVEINDGVANTVSNTTTTVVTAAYNDVTTITGASSNQAVNDNATITPFSSLTIDDVDSPDQTLTITIQLNEAGAGGSFTTNSLNTAGFTNSGGGSYTRTGTASALTTAVQALVFSPTENNIAIGSTRNVVFAISVTDGILDAVIDSDSSAVITPVNEALVIGGASANQAVNDNVTLSPFSAMTFSDADLPGQTFTLTITLDNAAKGEFTENSLSNNGFTSPSAGTYTRTGTPSQLQTAIRALVYNPADNRVAVNSTEMTTFTVTMADGLLADVTNSTTTVVSTSVNVAPTIGGAQAGQNTYDNQTIQPFTNVTIGDEDFNTLDVTVTIDDHAKGVFTPGSLNASGFGHAGNGVYFFTGNASDAQAAIRQLVFSPTENLVSVGHDDTATFEISVDDSIANQVTNNITTVISAAYDDATTVSGTATAQPVNDNATIQVFSGVTFTDVDSPAQQLTLWVYITTSNEDVFTSASITASGFTALSDYFLEMQGTAAQLTAAIQQLYIQPESNVTAIGSTSTFTVNIQMRLGFDDIFNDNSTTVIVTPVNDAASIGGVSAGQTVNDTSTVQPLSSVTFTDADVPAQTFTLTITQDDADKGEFTSSSLLSAGFTSPSAGIYTRTGTVSVLQAAARTLVFNPADNRAAVGNTETTTFTLALEDGLLASVTNSTTTVVSTSMNDAPTISGVVASHELNDNATVQPFSTMTIGDADSTQTQSITVTIDDSTKGIFTSASLSASGFSDAGGGTYTFSGTAADATVAIRQLVFEPTANRVAVGSNEVTHFVVSTDDGVANSVSEIVSATSVSVNNNPTVTGASASQAVNDNATLQPFSGVTIGDVDVSTTVSVTVTIDIAAKGVFTSASLNSAGFSNAGGGSYTFSGTAAAATTAIRALVFDPTNDRVAVGSTETSTFTVNVVDNSNGSVANSTTTAVSTAMNDAPTITGAVSGQAVNENGTVNPFSGVTIGDADTTQTLQVTITQDTAAKGSFTSASLTSAGFTNAGGGVYTRTGTATALTTAIRALAFDPANNRGNIGTTETTQFTLAVDDSVATVTNDSTTTVVSTSVNDAPTVSGTGSGQAVNDNATVLPFSSVTISDADVEGQTISLSITLDQAAKGVFSNTSLSNAGFADAGNGVYTRTGSASTLTTAIRQLIFVPTANRTAVGSTETTTFTLSMNDGYTTGTDSTTTAVSTSIDDATVISGAVAGQALDDNETAYAFADITFSDVDPSTLLNITVFGDSAVGVFTSQSLQASGFTLSGQNSWTLSNVSPAAATTAIRQLVYSPVANTQSVGQSYSDALSVRATTNSVNYDDTTTSMTITSVNDSPSVSGAAATEVDDDSTRLPFVNVTITDPDNNSGQVLLTYVTISNTEHGWLTEASLASSGFMGSNGTYTFSGTAAQATTAIRQLRFQPVANDINIGTTRSSTFTISVSDPTDANVSNTASVVTVTPVNDATVIGSASSGQAVNDNATITPFESLTISDDDGNTQLLTVSVSISNIANGMFTSESLSTSGFSYSDSGVYIFSGTASAAQTAIRQLVFQPTANRVAVGSTETTSFVVTTHDGLSSDVTSSDTSVVSTSMNDSPVLGGAGVGQTTSDNVSINPFSAFTVSDADPDQNLSVSIIYSATPNGSWSADSLEATGFVASGIYLVKSGTAAQVQAAIRGLTFIPTQNQVNVGSTRTSSFVVTVNDGGGQVMNTQTTVIATSVNDTPTISGVESISGWADNQTTQPFVGVTIGDVDLNQTQTVTVTLDSAAKGTFTSDSLEASGFVSSGNGVYTYSGSAVNATTAIRQLVFRPTANRVAVGASETTTFTISSTDNLSANVSNNNATISVIGINDTPTISNASLNQAFNDTGTIQPFSAVTIADLDPGQTLSVYVEQWSSAGGTFSSESLTSSGFTQLSSTSFRFTGTASAATTAIRNLTFVPVANRVAVGSVDTSAFSIVTYDASGASTGTTASVAAMSVNQAPTISGSSNVTTNDSTAVSPFAALTFADVDPGQQLTIYVQQWSTAGGTFSGASLTNSGFTQTSAGNFRFTGTASAATTAVRALSFVPTANRVAVGSTDVSTFSVIAYDASGSSAGSTSNVTATSINDAPTVSGIGSATGNDAVASQPFANATIADADPGQTLTVFISEWSTTSGAFTSASLANNGFSTISTGVHRVVGTASAVTSALRGLSYVASSNRVIPGSSTATNFSVTVYDASAASTGGTATLNITSVNDAPTLSGLANIGSIFDTATASPFSNTTIADVDVSAQLSVTIIVDNAAKGAFTAGSLVATGFTATGANTYTFSGTPAAATAAIRGLSFAPTLNRLTGGQSEAVTFSVSVSDGIASTVTNNQAALTAVGVNETPTIGSLTASLPALRVGQTITFTATGAADGDGTVTSVQFWRDVNGNGQVDDADALLASDSTGSDGYTATVTVASDWTSGVNTILARTVDNDGAGSAAASVNVSASANTGALVAGLASNVSSATNRQTIVLTASGVASSNGNLRSVTFYNDTNNNGQFDSADRSIVTDSTSSNGYTANVTIDPTWTAGQRYFFARATDGSGLGAAAALIFTVAPNNAPLASGISLSASTLPSNNRVTLTLAGASDSDGSISRVDYFADVNGNGVFDAGDRRLGSSTSASSLFSYNATLNRAWIFSGGIRIFAQATDNNGLGGSVLTTTIAA